MPNGINDAIECLEREVDALDSRRVDLMEQIENLRGIATEPTPDLPTRFRAARPSVRARDEAILARLRTGPAEVAELIDLLPAEPGETSPQRITNGKNALSRLRSRRLIMTTSRGWEIR